MTCHWVKDPDTGLDCFIPGCYGAIYAPGACTCEIEGSRLDRALAELGRAQETIGHLRAQLRLEHQHCGILQRNNNRLRDDIREARGLPPRKKIEISYP